MTTRTINEIRAEMIAAKDTYPELAGLSVASMLSRSRLWIYIVSVAIWTLEQILSIAINTNNKAILDQKRYGLKDYSTMAKAFQYGYNLPIGEVDYDNTGLSEEVVEASKIVKFASTNKIYSGLKIKVAKLVSGALTPLNNIEFEAFKAYIERVKAAGDYITFTNDSADHLKLQLKIFRNPLVLNNLGKRIDGTNDTPVADAVNDYIKSMDFDRKFIPSELVDRLQAVDGVVVPHIISIQSQYALFPYTVIPPEGIVPNAGYMRIYNPEDLIINYELWVE